MFLTDKCTGKEDIMFWVQNYSFFGQFRTFFTKIKPKINLWLKLDYEARL